MQFLAINRPAKPTMSVKPEPHDDPLPAVVAHHNEASMSSVCPDPIITLDRPLSPPSNVVGESSTKTPSTQTRRAPRRKAKLKPPRSVEEAWVPFLLRTKRPARKIRLFFACVKTKARDGLKSARWLKISRV